nr:NAD(P)-dependent oxidoreductase [Mesorhizobium sediminum]
MTGQEGQVAKSLVERASHHRDIEAVAIGRPVLDLQKPETVLPALASAKPDIVISAAAYTAVDRAEAEPGLAYAINEAGAGQVAAAAAELGVPIVHLSTDYVFDGQCDHPYLETHLPDPTGAYGASKLAGEMAVAQANPCHFIIRTAWVYSPFGNNFQNHASPCQ